MPVVLDCLDKMPCVLWLHHQSPQWLLSWEVICPDVRMQSRPSLHFQCFLTFLHVTMSFCLLFLSWALPFLGTCSHHFPGWIIHSLLLQGKWVTSFHPSWDHTFKMKVWSQKSHLLLFLMTAVSPSNLQWTSSVSGPHRTFTHSFISTHSFIYPFTHSIIFQDLQQCAGSMPGRPQEYGGGSLSSCLQSRRDYDRADAVSNFIPFIPLFLAGQGSLIIHYISQTSLQLAVACEYVLANGLYIEALCIVYGM